MVEKKCICFRLAKENKEESSWLGYQTSPITFGTVVSMLAARENL
jgi:hypothetical protein